jgi:hypothetical protein
MEKRGRKMSKEVLDVYSFLGLKVPKYFNAQEKSKLRYEIKRKIFYDLGYDVKNSKKRGLLINFEGKVLPSSKFYMRKTISFTPYYSSTKLGNNVRNSFSDFVQIFSEGKISYKNLLKKVKTMELCEVKK